MNRNKHLTLEDRQIIAASLNENNSFKTIGMVLNKDCTTIAKEVKRNYTVGDRWVWHDRSMNQWRLTVQLEETRYWFLSVFIKEDGTFNKFSLDYEGASDSHYEFASEAEIRDILYQPGDERLLFDEILIRYTAQHSGDALLRLISPYITAQFHF